MSLASIESALEDIKSGVPVIVVDDYDRENEGDLVISAEKATPQIINFMAKHGRGLICTPMSGARLDELEIPAMVDTNTDPHGTHLRCPLITLMIIRQGYLRLIGRGLLRVFLIRIRGRVTLQSQGMFFLLDAGMAVY